MDSYTPTVINNSDTSHTYVVFAPPPPVSENEEPPQLVANAPITLDPVAPGGQQTVQTGGPGGQFCLASADTAPGGIMIDFTGTGTTAVTVTQNADGSFTIDYSGARTLARAIPRPSAAPR